MHKYKFTKKEISTLLRKTGFEIKELDEHELLPLGIRYSLVFYWVIKICGRLTTIFPRCFFWFFLSAYYDHCDKTAQQLCSVLSRQNR